MNTLIRTTLLCIGVISLGILGACSEDPVSPQDPALMRQSAVLESATLESADWRSWTGTIGGTNLWEIRVPVEWNGEFVLYAHGFVDSAEPIHMPDKDNLDLLRDGLVEDGYAFAACSFRENGFAVKDGAWSVRQVGRIFRSKVREAPTYTWLMGQSLGGLVAVELTEKHPGEYDGILTVAGMVGGSMAEIDYMGDVRVLFDFFYPGVLPGSVCEPVEILDPNPIIAAAVGAVTADPNGIGVISRLLPLPGTDNNQIVQSLITAILFNYRGQPDLFARTNGECPYDNHDRVYAARWPGALPQQVVDMVNALVPRYERSIPVTELLERQYEPNGRLQVSMLSVHLENDPIVPGFHEQLYADKVAAAGASGLLEQRLLPGYGHTLEVNPSDVLSAFEDLRARVVPQPVAFARP